MRLIVLLSLPMALSSCAHDAGSFELPTEPPREWRAIWVATVANIDWPSSPGLTVEQQKSEALAIIERAVDLNANVIVFQVRPHADALYHSDAEPWSAYLTGKQGRSPHPYYDPLRFWVHESHRRGLQLHAWFNPYRANHPANPGELHPRSLVRSHPEMVVKLGNAGYWWMDPALDSVQQHSLAVITGVVSRYRIDGVHMDDYFYPYESYNDGKDFPDDASWAAYQAKGGELSRGDWRRAAVNRFIHSVASHVKRVKPDVAFGISPFGIWRPGHPKQIRGLDQYDKLYADARLWWNEGWVDYLTPQLYWPIAQVPQSFPVLLAWWQRENLKGRHLWPGTSIARQRGESGAREIVGQMMISRAITPESPGLCLFSAKWLMDDDDAVANALKNGPWREPALVPASPWLDDDAPDEPEITSCLRTPSGIALKWKHRREALRWIVWARRGGRWEHEILPARDLSFTVPGAEPEDIRVAAVDRCGNVGRLATPSLDD